MTDRVYGLWLANLPAVGSVCAHRLIQALGDARQVWQADGPTLRQLGFLRKSEGQALENKDLTRAKEIEKQCRTHGWHILALGDEQYPQRLAAIYDPPTVLYIRGHFPEMDLEPAVAVVGTRNATDYGIRMGDRVGYAFAKAGGLVLTGLALGVDAAAARGALRAGGRVVGVIGSGLDVVYPREHRQLFDQVAETGAIVTEYPPGTQPSKGNFPARNRIMSGLSLGVAVIEAPEKSGALITAARALEQGRDVFAVPGNADAPRSQGCNRLLREGAIPLTSGWELVEEYAPLYPAILGSAPEDRTIPPPEKAADRTAPEKKPIDNPAPWAYIDLEAAAAQLTGTEKTVFLAVGSGCATVDDILEKTGLAPGEVLAALTMLEISGALGRDAGKRYHLK